MEDDIEFRVKMMLETFTKISFQEVVYMCAVVLSRLFVVLVVTKVIPEHLAMYVLTGKFPVENETQEN